MKNINVITIDPKQKIIFTLDDGTSFIIKIRFAPLQAGWFIDELTYLNFVIHGVRICNSPNLLHQFRNQIPFGLACFSDNDKEPSLQQDFSSLTSVLSVLTEAEVQAYSEYLSDG